MSTTPETETQNQTQESSEQAKNFDAELLKEEIEEGEAKTPNADFDNDYEIAKANSENPVDAPDLEQKQPQPSFESTNTPVSVSESGDKKAVDVPEEFVDMAKEIEQG